MKLNTPPLHPEANPYYLFFFRLCFEQRVSFTILQDKASSHSAGEKQSGSFYLPLHLLSKYCITVLPRKHLSSLFQGWERADGVLRGPEL